MKNFFRMFGIIALAAVIGFSMIACGDGDDENSNNNENGNGNGNGDDNIIVGNLPDSYYEPIDASGNAVAAASAVAYRVVRGTEAPPNEVIIASAYNGKPVTVIGRPDDSSDNTVFYNRTNITSVQIPNSVTSIEHSVFRGCSNLTGITLPSNLKFISAGVFWDCTSLTGITIPASVTDLGKIHPSVMYLGAFYGCTSLTSVTFAPGSQLKIIGDMAFAGTSVTSITIPSGVTSIGSGAFSNCVSLTSITIPSGVTSIGNQTFYRCDSLTNITIPESVTSIGNWAFEGCTSLTSITIPSGVTSIGSFAFVDCTNVNSMIIPSSVTFIGRMAFYSWASSQTITIQGKANRAATIAAGWDETWDENCNATIVYQP
jgi:hypothetical protein